MKNVEAIFRMKMIFGAFVAVRYSFRIINIKNTPSTTRSFYHYLVTHTFIQFDITQKKILCDVLPLDPSSRLQNILLL